MYLLYCKLNLKKKIKVHLLSISRASPSSVLGQADTAANLGLTTARATTCQSNQQNASTGRVSTRSSSMILRDGREDYLRRMTPVKNVRGLIESLDQQQRKVALATQSSSPLSSASKSPTEKQAQSVRKQLLPHHHQGDATNSVKRKREEKPFESQETLNETLNAKNKEDTKASDSLSPKKSKCSKQMELGKFSRLSIPLSPQSQIFPILKLKRTSENVNSYVAVTAFSPQDSQLKEVCDTEIPAEPIQDGTAAKQPDDTLDTVHRHNTRFKARKGTEISLDRTNQPASILKEDCGPGKYMLVPNSDIRIKSELKGNSHSKCNTVISQRSSVPEKVQQNGNRHSNNIKVGDIVWGKVHGHPWWPGRVLGILCEGSETNEGCQIVKVSWYGSPTMSDISSNLLLLFQENFKRLFKKQKKGAYQLAVRQAQQDLEVYMNGTKVMPA